MGEEEANIKKRKLIFNIIIRTYDVMIPGWDHGNRYSSGDLIRIAKVITRNLEKDFIINFRNKKATV